MLLRFFPWKYFLHPAARRYDFLDPISFLARLRNFARPQTETDILDKIRKRVRVEWDLVQEKAAAMMKSLPGTER